MATITIYASTGVAKIDLQMSNGATKTIYENDHYSWTRLDSNSWIKVTDVDALSSYSNPYTDNYGNNLNNGHTYYFSDGNQNVYVRATYKQPVATYTVKIKPSTSVPSFSWRMSDGGSGTWSLQNDGPEASWTRAEGTELTITSCTPSSSYKHPVYYERTDQYQQQITNSDGTWKDRIISFTADKTGTLVATYVKPAATYTLHYDGNGATSGSMSDQTGNNSYYVKGNEFVRTGYVFRYWSDFNGHTYSPDQIIHLTADTTLHAIWAKEYYDIIYNDNGGTGGPNRQTKHIDEDLVISYTEPTRAGYVFMGWAGSSSADEADYLPGDTYDTNASTVLYAVWKIAHTVLFHYSELIEEYIAYDGEIITLEELEDTETERFVGWYYVQDGVYYEAPGGTDVIIDADIDFYSEWTTITYTITYDGNNATSGSSRTQSGSSTYTIYNNWFQRTGYAFQYWTYSDEYDQEHIYRPGDRVTPKRNMTLYAFWLRAYTITYHANGGTGAPSEQTKIHNVDLTLSSTVPTRSGYDFVNWYDGTDYYSPGGTYTANSPASLYAQWRLKTYTISYYANGGTGAPSEQTKTHGVDLTLSSVIPTRSGYDFVNWYDGTDYYSPGGTYRANSPASLYAQWRRKTYTVSYNANGGTGAPSAQTKTHGVDLTLSSTVPTNGNLRFMGWSTSSAASASAQYASGATYSGNDDLALYAVWRCVAAFYNGSSLLVEKLCPIGDSVTCPTMADSENRGLYMWQVAHSSQSYSPGATIQNLSESITLLAVWKTFYTISYNGNGGSDTVTSLPSDQRKWEDIDITLSTIRPARSGYEFFGWSTSSEAMAPRQYEPGDTYSKNESAVLYAIWRVVVICYSNGSQYGSSLYARIGGEITLPSPPPTATQVCTGWKRRDDTTIIYTPGQTLEINISFILDAIWQNGFTLTYNDGGSGGGNSVVHTPLAITYDIWTVGQCHFTKAGSVFQHWSYTDDDGFPQTIKPLQSFTPTRSLTMYAVWKARDKFYWHGSDQADATYFAVGERVDLAITATAWNAFLDFVNDVREDAGLARINFRKVTAGKEFSAFDFNRVRNNIDPMIPNNSSIVLPSTVSAGDEIVTSQYNGSGSLKDAINQIVDLL